MKCTAVVMAGMCSSGQNCRAPAGPWAGGPGNSSFHMRPVRTLARCSGDQLVAEKDPIRGRLAAAEETSQKWARKSWHAFEHCSPLGLPQGTKLEGG